MIKKVQQFWRHFMNDVPLRRKFTVINVFALTVTLLMSVLILYHIRRVIVSDSIQSGEAVVTQTGAALRATVSSVATSSDSVASVRFLARMAYSENLEELLSEDEETSGARDFFDNIQALVDGQVITAIRIYVPPRYERVCEAYRKENVFAPIREVTGSYWHGIFNGRPGLEALFCPDFYLTRKEAEQYGGLAYIRKYAAGAESQGSEPTAYIAVYFSRAYLEEILQENRTAENSISYLVNSRGNIVASSDEARTAIYYLDYQSIPQQIEGLGFIDVTVLDQKLYMAYRDIEGTDWRLVSAIPRNALYSEGMLFTRLAAVYIVIVLLSLVLQVILSGSLSARITGITGKIRQQKKIETKDGQEAQDEIGHLTQTYNSMLDQLQSLAKQQTETAEKLRVSEVRALQAQINPHFLYNMLDMINWLAMAGNREGVSEAVRSLSKFYKLTLSSKDIMILIREELQHVELYVKLQNMRFEDKIHFLVDVPDEILDYRIPKLVLQPIVENAILHGIFEKEDKEGNIVITAWEELHAGREAEDIVFTVSDDGVGIPSEKLAGLLQGETSAAPAPATDSGQAEEGSRHTRSSGTNVAIYNTHHRLVLLYGPEYGLKFSSVYGEGTEVQIRIRKRAPG